MTGGVTSTTLKPTEQAAALPAASVTVTTMVWAPQASNVPAAGFWVLISSAAGVPLSDATRSANKSGTAAWPFSPTAAVRLGGQSNSGAASSTTVTTTVSSAEAPAGSL